MRAFQSGYQFPTGDRKGKWKVDRSGEGGREGVDDRKLGEREREREKILA